MASNDQVTNVEKSLNKEPNINRTQQHFMKLLEAQNRERVERLTRIRRNNLLIGSTLGCGVLGIYFYTMYAVKQERFLDDFEEPEKTVQ